MKTEIFTSSPRKPGTALCNRYEVLVPRLVPNLSEQHPHCHGEAARQEPPGSCGESVLPGPAPPTRPGHPPATRHRQGPILTACGPSGRSPQATLTWAGLLQVTP